MITCNKCGACCMEQCSPPMFVWLLTQEPDDPEICQLPQELKDELLQYHTALLRGDTHPQQGICIWLDLTTKMCKHYEHRPTICRAFEIGSQSCQEWRDIYVDLEIIV